MEKEAYAPSSPQAQKDACSLEVSDRDQGSSCDVRTIENCLFGYPCSGQWTM